MKPENFAERIRGACLEAALKAYEDAGMQGLCAEGRWEVAVDALRTLDLAPLWREFPHSLVDVDNVARKDKNAKTQEVVENAECDSA